MHVEHVKVVVHPSSQHVQSAAVGWYPPTNGSLKRSKITDGVDTKAAATWLQNVIEWSASAMGHC